jgi:hypothetical protein
MTALPNALKAGAKVFLRACRVGKPGTVIREQRGKLTVYWPDLDYWSRHRPEALENADMPTIASASNGDHVELKGN